MHVEKGPPEAVIANLQLGLIAHGHIQLSFKYPQEWKFCNLSVQAVPIFSHFNCKKKKSKISVSSRNFPCSNLFSVSLPLCTSKKSGFFSVVLVRYLDIAIRSTLTLLFLRLNHVSQPLFFHHMFHYLHGDSLLDFSHVNHFLVMERPRQNIPAQDVLLM